MKQNVISKSLLNILMSGAAMIGQPVDKAAGATIPGTAPAS